jgi:acetyl esterase/lipase
MRRVLAGLAVAAAVLMVAIAIWTVVPAPTLPTLALAVLVPELAVPLVAIFALLATGCWFATRGRVRVVVMSLCAIALAATVWPALAAPWTAWHADDALRAGRIAPLPDRMTLAAVDVERDVPVRLRDGTASALDLYRPRIAGRLPLLVTIYGGAWIFGSRGAEAPLARRYAARGYAVAVIDYRHAPVYRFPTQIDDVDDALATIAHDAHGWNVDVDRVALFGRSAGAQLALLAGERTQPLHVRAIVAYYAPTDLVEGWNDPPVPDPAGTKRILIAYLGGPPDASRIARYRAASPLDVAHAGMPPVLAIIGDRDELVRPQFQRTFAARLDALHVPNVAIELPWSNHAFDAIDGLGAGIAHDATLRFLNATTR